MLILNHQAMLDMKVHVLGNVAVDEIFPVRAMPEPGQSVLARTRMRDLGGKGANQAIVIARTGLDVRLIAGIGDDEAGRWLRRELTTEGLDTAGLVACSGPSDMSVVILGDNADNMIVTTNGAARQLTIELVTFTLRDSNPGDVLLLQGNLAADVTGHALKIGRVQGLTTVFNPSPADPAFANYWPLADLVVLNRTEALELTGQPDHLSAGSTILAEGARQVVITLGEKGAALQDRTGAKEFPAAPAIPVDTTGAGDTFAGILVAAMALSGSIDGRAIAAAAAAAAITVSRPGTRAAFPRSDEIKAILTRHGLC
jgi:ribokinase